MTVGAADILTLVCSAFPEAVFLLGVAILADLILALLGPRRIRTESRHRRPLLAEANPAGMISARAVTGLALVTAERRAFVGHHAVRAFEDCIEMGALLVAVTTHASIGAAA